MRSRLFFIIFIIFFFSFFFLLGKMKNGTILFFSVFGKQKTGQSREKTGQLASMLQTCIIQIAFSTIFQSRII